MSDEPRSESPDSDKRAGEGERASDADGDGESAPASGRGDSGPPESGASPGSTSGKPEAPASPSPSWRPDYVFLVVVSVVSLVLDLGSKAWAKAVLDDPKSLSPKRVEVIADHFGFVFARNKGGAWGLLQDESEAVRRPFFLLISAAAVVFIVSLYRKLAPGQTALKWGLPLVLGGALGNLVDRVRYGYVVDFIDVRADAIRVVNSIFAGDRASDHWPTFNVADIAICVGVGLMAVDMFTSRKKTPSPPARVTPAPSKPAPRPPDSGSDEDDPPEPADAPSPPRGAA